MRRGPFSIVLALILSVGGVALAERRAPLAARPTHAVRRARVGGLPAVDDVYPVQASRLNKDRFRVKLDLYVPRGERDEHLTPDPQIGRYPVAVLW